MSDFIEFLVWKNDRWEPITRYIKDQYATYLRKELSPTREPLIQDTRVHCVVYFIAPQGKYVYIHASVIDLRWY